MSIIILMGISCACGAFVRYGLSRFNVKFPYGTLLANCLGCFCIGFLYKHVQGTDLYLILATGFCGGLTTYSTLNLDWILLSKSSKLFIFYALFSYCLSFLSLLFGIII